MTITLPVRVNENAGTFGLIEGSTGLVLARVESKPVAAEITRRVNAFDGLVKIVCGIRDKHNHRVSGIQVGCNCGLCQRIDAALAAAKEGA